MPKNGVRQLVIGSEAADNLPTNQNHPIRRRWLYRLAAFAEHDIAGPRHVRGGMITAH
jgi:hypothetical protein